MQDFQNVLFPVDFSERCESTVPYVKEMVHRYGAKLTLLHVVEIPTYWYGTMPLNAALAWDLFQETY